MCTSKKADFNEYPYKPIVKRKPCGISFWFIFYLVTFVAGSLILVFLRYAINEIKHFETISTKNRSDNFVISYFIHLVILLSFYCLFLLLLVFLPVRLYGACAYLNTAWCLLTLIFTISRELSTHLEQAPVAREKMKNSLLYHKYATPIILGYSGLLTLFLLIMRRLMKAEQVKYSMMDGSIENGSKTEIP